MPDENGIRIFLDVAKKIDIAQIFSRFLICHLAVLFS